MTTKIKSIIRSIIFTFITIKSKSKRIKFSYHFRVTVKTESCIYMHNSGGRIACTKKSNEITLNDSVQLK